MAGAIGKNRVVAIKSADRMTGTPSNFAINLGQYNLNPTYVSYKQLALPNGFYNITTRNNAFTITIYNPTVNSWTPTLTLPPGNYNSINLCSTLATLLNNYYNQTTGTGIPHDDPKWASNANMFTASVSSTTGQFTLTMLSQPGAGATAGWAFRPIAGGLANTLFSNTSISPARYNSFTGNQILDLRVPAHIYIRSNLVAGNYLTASGPESVLAVIQNPAVFGQTIFAVNNNSPVDIFPVSGRIGMVTFQLVDEYGQELNMDTGQEWELSVAFYTP